MLHITVNLQDASLLSNTTEGTIELCIIGGAEVLVEAVTEKSEVRQCLILRETSVHSIKVNNIES